MHATLNTRQKVIFTLKIVAPYIAVITGLYIFNNAWLSIFLYHGQIVFWWLIGRGSTSTRENTTPLILPERLKQLLTMASKGMLPISALAGVACYFLLPYMVRDIGGLELWLSSNQLTGMALLLLIPYFGILHPPIEQTHWQPLIMLHSPYRYISHISFAAYHGLVLYPILQPIWIVLCLIILSFISFLWSYVRQQKNGRTLTVFSHIFADIGIVSAAYLYTL